MKTSIETRPISSMPLAPAGAGITALLMAVYQVATPSGPAATYDTLLDWSREVLFLSFLVLSILATIRAARRATAPRATAVLVAVGYGAVAAGVTAGMVMREDPEWFFLLGGPGNLLAMAGFVTWAVWAWRRKTFPALVAVLCGLGGVVAVLGSEFGSSVLIAGFWFYVASHDK
jgi:hypothetical protein